MKRTLWIVGILGFLAVLCVWAIVYDSSNNDLKRAVESGNVAALRAAITAGADVETLMPQNPRGTDSPLHVACGHGQVEIVRILLEAGADPMSDDGSGETPAMTMLAGGATDSSRLECLELLLAQDAFDPNHQDIDGRTALHSAVDYAGLAFVKTLLEHGADPNLQSAIGWTALHSVADRYNENGGADIAKLLFAAGADPCILTIDGRTALDIAKKRGRDDVAHVIEAHMASSESEE